MLEEGKDARERKRFRGMGRGWEEGQAVGGGGVRPTQNFMLFTADS